MHSVRFALCAGRIFNAPLATALYVLMDLEDLPLFEVEDISSIENVGVLIFARRLDQIDFELNEKSLLGGVPVTGGDIPRKLSKSGEPSFSTWGFFLKNEKDKDKFHKGKKVQLTHSHD